MLTLDKRPCLIGSSRGDIGLTSVMLEGHELNDLLDDPDAWNCWFRERKSALPVPAPWTEQLRRFSHLGRFRDSRVTLFVGFKAAPIALANVRISNVRLAPQVGGLTELSVTCTPASAVPLVGLVGEFAEVQLDLGDRADKRHAPTYPRLAVANPNPRRATG